MDTNTTTDTNTDTNTTTDTGGEMTPAQTPGTRRCSRCEQFLAPGEFNFKNKAAGVLQSQCRACSHLSSREHYERNTDKVKARSAARNATVRSQRRAALHDLRREGHCEECLVAGTERPLQLSTDGSGQRSTATAVRSVVGEQTFGDVVSSSVLLCQRCASARAARRRRASEGLWTVSSGS